MGETENLIEGNKLNYRSKLFCLPLPVLGMKAGPPAFGGNWVIISASPFGKLHPHKFHPHLLYRLIYTKDFSFFRVCTEDSTYS